MIVRFVVQSLPPKKDGAESMWGKRGEVAKLKALRLAAKRALGVAIPPPGAVAVEVTIYALERHGDLDNLIGGIADGLMAARVKVDPAWWADVPPEIGPMNAVAFKDDARISRWVVERIPPGEEGIRYEVELRYQAHPMPVSEG